MAEATKTTVRVKGEAATGAQNIYLSTPTSGSASKLDKRLPATYATYRRIRRHPTVALARALTIAPVIAADWSVEADDDVDDERVRFIQAEMMPIREPLVQTAMEFGRIDYGWAPFEKVFETRAWDGKDRIRLSRLKPLLVDMTDILIDYETGEFAGFRQPAMYGRTTELILEADYCLLVNFSVEGDNLYGEPLLENVRRIYGNWEDSNEAAERYDLKMAGAQWVVHYPIGTTMVDGVDTDNAQIAKMILDTLEASGSVSVPRKIAAYLNDLNQGAEGDVWTIELMDHTAKQYSFIARLNYCDKLIVRGLLSPERAILESQYGTKAEADAHASLAMSQRELEHRHVTRIVNESVVDQLLTLNYGEDARGTVRLVASPLTNPAVAFFRDVYRAILAHPTASMDAIEGLDLDALLDAIGLPKAQEIVGADEGPVSGTDSAAVIAAKIRALYEAAAQPAAAEGGAQGGGAS